MKKIVSFGLLSLVVFFVNCKADLVNVALSANGGVATAISEGTYMGTLHPASHAINGLYTGQPGEQNWCSNWDMPAWIKVEFNQLYLIQRVAVEINYHQQTYAVSLSVNGNDWVQVVSPRLSGNIPTVVPTNISAGASYEVFDINPTAARFMKVDITTTTAPSSHIFQAIVGEMEAYTIPEPASLVLVSLGGMALRKFKR